jgi:predicted  nucleic acid-binding Zn-ribbon protein
VNVDKKLASVQPPSPDNIECPLCRGEGELTRAEILDRLGVKDFARVAQLSAEEAFRLLQTRYRMDGESLWTRFEGELTRRVSEAEQRHVAKVQELEARIKLSKEQSAVESQRIRAELEAKVRSEQSGKEDLRRRVEEYLSDLSRLRTRNQELEMEMSKAARRGKLEELSFEGEVRTWPGICISEKLPKNGDYLLAFRDPSGAALYPAVLVDNKDKSAITEADIKKLIRDAKERHAAVGVLVTREESQLRQGDRECRWAQEDGVWILRTTRVWFRRDLDVLRPLLERMRTEGADFLQRNVALAEEIRRTLVDLDEIEKELKKAAKAIDAASGLTTKYRSRLRALCDSSGTQKKMPERHQVGSDSKTASA